MTKTGKNESFVSKGGMKRVLLTSVAGMLSVAMVAPAQAQDPVAPAGETTAATQTADIIVTGSRIARRDYQANSPIITANDALLTETSSSAIEQNLNKLPQFTPTLKNPTQGGDIQPTATNTPGAATISLRGIGANRNLVLLDGRRATPSNASMVVDINSIPAAAIERVEIISGGASATYGADAVGGVVNFILKKDFTGLELDAQNSLSQHGDNYQYTLSGIMGASLDDGRGNVTLAFSTNQRDGSFQRNRSWYRQMWADPSIGGASFFSPYGGYATNFNDLPTAAALNSVIPGATFVPVGTNQKGPSGTTIYTTPNGNIFSGFDQTGQPGISGFGPVDGYSNKITDAGVLAHNNTFNYLVLPLKRWNMYARGHYEINDWLGVFAQGTFSKTSTRTIQEPGPIVSGWAVNIDPTINRDVIPAGLLTILDSRIHYAGPGEPGYVEPTEANPDPLQPQSSAANAPFQLAGLLPFNRASQTDVYTYNMLAGLEGTIPGTDWTFEVYGSQGESETSVLQTGFASLQRLTAIVTQPNFGQGFSVTGNQGPPNFGFGAATATCTSGLNLFDPASISQDCIEAIKADIKTKAVMQQTVWEGNVTGSLFALPAGNVKVALGASYRSNSYKFQNDTLTTQGTSFIEQALGLYPAGNSSGKITAKEVYGELLVPLLSDIPGVERLELELGGRISDYNTTGTSYTYKILGDWQVTNWLRFRGGYNRAERTPNISELFLAAQQTFAGQSGDVCSTQASLPWSANPDVNPTNYQNVIGLCGQLMERSGNPDADVQYWGPAADYRTLMGASPADVRTLVTLPQAAGGGFAFPTLTGNPNLTPETADTWTAGAVISSPFDAPLLSRLRLTIDYYRLKVNHAIGQQSVDIVMRQCVDPAFNPTFDPNSPFCDGFARNQTGAVGNISQTFLNNGRFRTSGIDVQVDWAADVGPGTINFNTIFNYLIEMKAAELPSDPMLDYAGSQGPTINGLDGSSYRWKLFTTLGYTYKGAYLGLQWRHLPGIRSNTAVLAPNTTVTGVTESYDLFNLQASYAVTKDVTLRFGIDNLFDKAPPYQGINPAAVLPALPGGSFDSNNYDTIGRSFYMGAKFKF